MAESKDADNPDGCSGGGWWSGWFQAAKEKSAHALEFMKKDLTEFTTVMQQESSKAVSKTSETLKETLKTENTAAATDKLKHGISKFLDGITKALVVEAEDKYETPIRPREDTANLFDRAKARLHAIQIDPGTYLNELSGTAKNFKEWQEGFDMEQHKGDISELLVSKVEVRALYTKLVPAEVSHADFWQRYFYKVHQLQQDEARKLALMQRAEMAGKKEESVSWDEEWSSDEEEARKDKGKQKINANETAKTEHSETEKTSQSENISTEDSISKQPSDKNVKTGDNVLSVNKMENSAVTEQTVEKSVKAEDSDVQNSVSADQDSKSDSANLSVETCDKPLDKERVATEQQDTLSSEKEKEVDQKAQVSDVPVKVTEKQTETVNSEKETKEEDKSKISVSEKQDKSENKTSHQEQKEKISKETDLKVKEKGDTVVVNPDRESPSSESSGNKDIVSLDEDWEQDFDVELTEEDLKAADEIAKKLNLSSTDYTKIAAEVEGDEDWESWN